MENREEGVVFVLGGLVLNHGLHFDQTQRLTVRGLAFFSHLPLSLSLPSTMVSCIVSSSVRMLCGFALGDISESGSAGQRKAVSKKWYPLLDHSAIIQTVRCKFYLILKYFFKFYHMRTTFHRKINQHRNIIILIN